MASTLRVARILLLVSALSLATLSPAWLTVWGPEADALAPLPFPATARPFLPVTQADLDGDGLRESIALSDGQARIMRGPQTLWSSDPAWQVMQAQAADLDRDGRTEVILLLWRAFSPWPIDAYLPFSGRIAGFQDHGGRSCHLILIGWERHAYRELWAGSAMSDPLMSIAIADLDADGRHELVGLEGRYQAPSAPAQSVTAWKWNGFGFTLLGRSPSGRYRGLTVLRPITGPDVLLVTATAWR